MKVVYVAGAYRGNSAWQIHKNVLKAEEAGLRLWKQGYVPIVPHKLTEFFQNECPDEVWLKGCIELLKRCDAIYLLRGFRSSVGSIQELKIAKELGLEIIYEHKVSLREIKK